MSSPSLLLVGSFLFWVLNTLYLWRWWQQIKASDAFCADDKTVLGFQIVCVVILLMGVFEWFVPVLDRRLGLLILAPFFIFIGITSIIYRVSIIVPGGQKLPAQGEQAIGGGVFILGIPLVLGILTFLEPLPF